MLDYQTLRDVCMYFNCFVLSDNVGASQTHKNVPFWIQPFHHQSQAKLSMSPTLGTWTLGEIFPAKVVQCTWLPVWKQSESGNMTLLFSRGISSTNLVVWKWGAPPSLTVYHPFTEEKVPFWVQYVSFSDQPKYQIEMIKLVIKLYDFPLYSIIYNEHYTASVTTINTIINTIKQQGFFHYTPLSTSSNNIFIMIFHYTPFSYTIFHYTPLWFSIIQHFPEDIFQRIFPEDFQRQEISRWPWCHLKVCCAAAAAQWLERPMAPGGRAEMWVWKKRIL